MTATSLAVIAEQGTASYLTGAITRTIVWRHVDYYGRHEARHGH